MILRAAPGTPDRRDEFLAWARRVRHLLNPPGAVAWNLDERYLRDLENDGVATFDRRQAVVPDLDLLIDEVERVHE